MMGRTWTSVLSVAVLMTMGCARLSVQKTTKPLAPAKASMTAEPAAIVETDIDLMLESAQDSFVKGIHQYKRGQYELAREYLSDAIEQVIAADFLDPTIFDNRLKIYDDTEVPLSLENGRSQPDSTLVEPVSVDIHVPVDQLEPLAMSDVRVPEDQIEPVAISGEVEQIDDVSGETEPVTEVVEPEPVEPEVTYDLPVVINEYVETQIKLLQSGHNAFQAAIDRSGRYMPQIKAMLRHEGLPEDLAYLAMIESYYKPRAHSRVGAAGLWQFMPKTANNHGLQINWYVDERYNVEKATYAAISYLSHLQELFKGDWLMAMSAYNMGEGGLLLRAALRAGTQDFWKLLKINPSRRYLPTETKQFVPRILAAIIISKEPEKYGFRPSNQQPVPVDQIAIEGMLQLAVLARICDVSVDELRGLNPELRRNVTPPQDKPYMLTIPVGTRALLEETLAKLPVENGVHAFTYKVRRGDTLSRIAAEHGTTVEEIMAHNGLTNHIIRVKQSLMIPGAGAAGPRMTDGGVLAAGSGGTTHIIASGDTLWDIAKVYGTTVTRLRDLNGLYGSKARSLRPGQKIIVHAAPRVLARETSAGVPRSSANYTVMKGDSLWSIARKYRGVSVDDIVRWNSLRSGTIRPGDRLVVSGSH